MKNLIGKRYPDGATIVQQGDSGTCMYVIQSGKAEVLREEQGRTVRVCVLEAGDIVGEMAIIEHETRSATVKAIGETRVLTVDRRTFLRRVKEDPTLAFNVLRAMAHRLRHLNSEVASLRRQLEQSRDSAAARGLEETIG